MDGLESVLRHQPLAAAAALFVAGLATSLTPCVYPMIPITAGILGGAGAERRSRGRTVLLTLVYVLIMGNLLLVFGLALLDVFTVEVPAPVTAWIGRMSGNSVGGVFALGATSGLVAAPCGAPAFAAVLTFVSTTGSAVLGFLYLFVFSLGLTALLVIVGLSSGGLATALPRSGRWTRAIKRFGGVLLLLMAEYYFVRMGSVL